MHRTVLDVGKKSIYTSIESWEQWSFRFEIKLQDFFMKKLKKFDFFDFWSQKIIISYRPRLNFWKNCQDSKVFFFTILTGFPEIQPRPSRDYNFLGSKITKSTFSTFSQQNPVILFQIWMTIVLSFLLRCITFL